MSDDARLDEVILRRRPQQTKLYDSVISSHRTSDNDILSFGARNTTNMRAKSYGSTQDLRPSSMADMSSSPKSSNRLRDIGRSSTMETRTLPSLRPLLTGRPFSASMVNLSHIGSADVGGCESKRFLSNTYGPRTSKTEYPKTRQKDGAPFQVDVLKGIAGIGIKVKVTQNGYAQITDIQRGGPVDKNGQARVGDNILFVNTTELTGHTDARVQQVLRLLPRGLTKLVVSGAPLSENKTETEDHDKFKTALSKQFIEKQPPAHSSVIAREPVSFHANDDILHSKALTTHSVPSFVSTKAVPRNIDTRNPNSDATETTPTNYLNESSHLSYKSRPGPDVSHGDAFKNQVISLNETDEVYSGHPDYHHQGGISYEKISDLNAGRTHMAVVEEENMPVCDDKSESVTNVNMSGSLVNVADNSVVSSKAITGAAVSTEVIFNDDPHTMNHPLSRSIVLTDNADRSTISPDNIDQSTSLSHIIERSELSFENEDFTSSVTAFQQSTFPLNNNKQSRMLPNTSDNASMPLNYFDQPALLANSTQHPQSMPKFDQRSENCDTNVTLSLPENDLALTSSTANEEQLGNVQSHQWSISNSEQLPKLYKGVLVTLVNVDGDKSKQSKSEAKMQSDIERPQTTTNVVNPLTASDSQKASFSVTQAETNNKATNNKPVSEQPVPKKRISLIENVSTEPSKAINTSLIPIQERRRNKMATLPPAPSAYHGTSSLYASRSLSVSTPALHPRRSISLEPSHRNTEGTDYQRKSVLSPPPKNAASDSSLDNFSLARIAPMYARSSSVSSPALNLKKIVKLDHSVADSESSNHHSAALLSPAPLNSALSPRRTSSNSSHVSTFVYPTHYTHTNKDDHYGRLSGSKSKTSEHPHVYKTIKSELYKAVHPDIYKSASVTMLEKKLMSPEYEPSVPGHSYGVVHQTHAKSPASTNHTLFSSLNNEVGNTLGLGHAVNNNDKFVSSSSGVIETNSEDTLLWADGKGVSPSMTKDLGTTSNGLSQVSEIKRPVAPARKLRKHEETEINNVKEDPKEKQPINTQRQTAGDIVVKEQTHENSPHVVVKQTKDLLPNETTNGNAHILNMLEETRVSTTEIHEKSAKATNIYHENENGIKYKINNENSFDGSPQLSNNFITISKHTINNNSSNISNTSKNGVSDSENSMEDVPEKKKDLLQTQLVFTEDGRAEDNHKVQKDQRTTNTQPVEESELIKHTQIIQEFEHATSQKADEDKHSTNIQKTQNVNEIFTAGNVTDGLVGKGNRTHENKIEPNTFEKDILAGEISHQNDEVIHALPGSLDSTEGDPPLLPDTPPPLPSAPPPVFILGGNNTSPWEEQTELLMENKVEETASSISQTPSKDVQQNVNRHTREPSTFASSEITSTNESPVGNIVSVESQIYNTDIDHAKEDIRMNSLSYVDMLSEDSGMAADEDQEVATDDTTSTPGELADNTFGLESLRHVPCSTDIEARLFPMHEVSLSLLSSSVQETDNLGGGSDTGSHTNIFDISNQSVQTFDVFDEHGLNTSLPPPILPISVLPSVGVSTISEKELPTHNSTTVQERDIQPYAIENTTLATDFVHAEKQEMFPSTAGEETRPEYLSAVSDTAEINNAILRTCLDDSGPNIPVSESLDDVTDNVISNRKLCLKTNTSKFPVLTSEAGVPIRVNYTQENLLKSLPYDAFVRLIDKANAVLDAASAPERFTLLVVHLHRDTDSVPLGVDLKHEGGIWFRVSGIKNGSPVWKEGGVLVGDWLLAVDSLWCDDVTTMRFLSRLSKPKHDSLLVFCRPPAVGADNADSPAQDVKMPSIQNNPVSNKSQHSSVSSQEQTTEASPSKLTSLEVKTKLNQQLVSHEEIPVHRQQSLNVTEQAQEVIELAPPSTGQPVLQELEQRQTSLEIAPRLLDEALLQEEESTLSEITPFLPALPPSLQTIGKHPGKDSSFGGKNPSLQGFFSTSPDEGLLLEEQSPRLSGKSLSLQGQNPLLTGDILSPLSINPGPQSPHTICMDDQNQSYFQPVLLTSQISNQSSSHSDLPLKYSQSEETFQVSKRAQEMQQESIPSPTSFQEISAKSVNIQQPNVSENTATSNEHVPMRQLPTRSTRRLNVDQGQSDPKTPLRREYVRSASRKSLEKPLKDLQPKDLEPETIVSSAELTADAGPGVYRVMIITGDTGVGFSLEGGVGSSKGDLPITIKKIFKGGPAEKSGLLKVNDEILEVNGLKFSNMRLYDAWNHLKRLGDGEHTVTIHRR